MSATSIATELTRIQTAKADIKTAIEAKGVQVPSNALIDTYDTYIGQISGGGTKDYIVESAEYDPTATYTGDFNIYSQIIGVNIPYGFTSTGYMEYCSNLTSITIPSSVTSISTRFVRNNTKLTSFVIPDTVTTINNEAFYNCSGLTSVTIGNGVTSIGNSAFNGCSGLTSITIPNSVTSIGNNVFANCIGLTSMIVDSGNTTYDSRDKCNAIIETTTNTLLYGCKNTVIPNSVTSIGSGAFIRIQLNQRDLTIPDSVTSIGDSAFYNCTSLRSVTIGTGITNIDASAFRYCSSITTMTVVATTPPTLGNNALNGTNANLVIYVPAESVETYKTTGNWVTYADRIQAIPSE